MGKNGKLLNLNSDSPKYGNKSLVTKEQENELKRLCQNADTAFFYAQSPDFLKPGLCYYPKFSYL